MTADEYHAEQLEKLRVLWDAGIYPALFQAVRYCGAVSIALPEWASLAVLNMIQDRYHDGSVGGANGAHGSLKGRVKMNYAHYLRWNALRWTMVLNCVSKLPDKRGRKKADLDKKESPTKKSLLAEAAKRLEGQRPARAADTRQTDAGVGRQIEESYRLVEASRQAGEKRFAFDDLYFPLT